MKAHHGLVSGDSGTGKSTLLAEMAARFDGLTIIVDPAGDQKFSGHNLDTETVRSESGIKQSSKPIVTYRPTNLDRDLSMIREVAKQYRRQTGQPVQIILDESQQVFGTELDPSHPAKGLLHEDRDNGIKFVLATQDPSDLQPNYSALKQCRHMVFVGPPSPFHEGFVRYFSLPKDEMPEQDYRYVVFGKGKLEWTVEYRGETSTEYA